MSFAAPLVTVISVGALLLRPAVAVGDTVHYLTSQGWQDATPAGVGGRVGIRLDPSSLGRSNTALVVNKPAWMSLSDDAPPAVAGVRVDDQVLPAAPGVLMGAFWQLPDEIRVAVADGDNPLDFGSLRVETAPGTPSFDWEFIPSAGPTPQHSGELRLRPGNLAPGLHELTLALSDRSPFANRMRHALRLAVNGVRVSDNGQRIVLVAGGVEYVVQPDPERFLTIGRAEVHLEPTVQFRTPYYTVRKFTDVRMVLDEPAHKLVRVEAAPSELHSSRPSRHVALQFDFELAGASKLLRVTTRLINRSTRSGEASCYWGWFPGQSYQLPSAEPGVLEQHSFSRAYREVGPADWVFLPAATPGRPGIGILTEQPLAESKSGALLVYAAPRHASIPVGGTVELTFGVVPASSPEDLLEARRQFEQAADTDAGTTVPVPT